MKFLSRLFCVLALLMSFSALPAQTLTHGPVVGNITDVSADFVYRVDAAATLSVEVSTDPGFASSLVSTSVPAIADSDFFAKMSIAGLTASTLYYYRPVIDGTPLSDGITRSFRTFPIAGSDAEFSFLFGSGQQNGEDPWSNIGSIFPEMSEVPNALFTIEQGDWGYPDTTDSEQGLPGNYFSLDYANIQATYRARYRLDYPMIQLLRRMGTAYTYDDHDFMNDNADHFGFPWAAQQNAIRGFRFLYPGYPLANADAGIWHSFRCGDAEIFMADNRTQRSPNLVGFSYTVSGSETTWVFNPPADKLMLNGDPAVTDDQMEWLLNGLSNSTAQWKFISTGTSFNPGIRAAIELALLLQHSAYDPIIVPGEGGEPRILPIYQVAMEFADKWPGFPESIRQLVQYVIDHQIENVILLSGDSHTCGLDDGANSIFPELMAGGLDRSNSQENALMQQFGIPVWNKGGHTIDLPPELFGNAYGKVTVFGTDSVRLEAVAEGGTVIGQHTVTDGFLPDEVNLMVAPYGLDFGQVLFCRAPGVQAFIALSTSSGTLQVVDIQSTDPHFMLMPGFPTSFSLESGQKMIVPVLYFPTAEEVNQGALVVISNDPQAPTLVYLQGQGVAQDTCEIEAGIYRTETQGGWGQDCHGNNLGCLRDANFASVFPNGLVVGGDYTLTLTTSQAVADLLPTGGKPGPLSMSYVDPTETSAGNFAGKVVALAINVAFGDAGAAGFVDMGSLIVAYGPFMNYTVDELLALANAVLGGDLSALPEGTSLEDLNTAVANVNGNFTDGGSYGYLLDPCCDPAARGKMADNVLTKDPVTPVNTDNGISMSNYPNPFNPTTDIAFELSEAGLAKLTVYNVMGQTVAVLVNESLDAGLHHASFDGTRLPSGLYIYRLEANGQSLQKKMLLMK